MDDRTRRAIGIIAAIALFGGGFLAAVIIYLAEPSPVEQPLTVEPPLTTTVPDRPEAEPSPVDGAIERVTEERLRLLRQLEGVAEEAGALAETVREMGRQQEDFDRAADALERRIELLEQQRRAPQAPVIIEWECGTRVEDYQPGGCHHGIPRED